MSYYIKENNTLWPTPEGAIDLRSSLPVGTYTVLNSIKGLFLQEVDDFKITGKVYGNATRHAERILNTFKSRPNATGVLLTGEKGSGKTLLAKMTSQNAQQEGISTLVINTPLHGEAFNNLIQSIDEPKIVIFDEFEKVYGEQEQEAILTLLDGVYPSKTLFMLTSNDRYRINQHMQNRPGRVFYMIDFAGLDIKFIEEYCQDALDAKEYIPTICRLSRLFAAFNFDMLKALVEEMNRYKESPQQALEMLNAKPLNERITHEVELRLNGKVINEDSFRPNKFPVNPMTHQEIRIEYYADNGAKDDEGEIEFEEIPIVLKPQHLTSVNADSGTYTYTAEGGFTVVFTKEVYKAYNYLADL